MNQTTRRTAASTVAMSSNSESCPDDVSQNQHIALAVCYSLCAHPGACIGGGSEFSTALTMTLTCE